MASSTGTISARLLTFALSLILAVTALGQAAHADQGEASGPGLQAGGIVFVAPKYEGGKEYEVRGFPMIAPSGLGVDTEGRVQFRGPDDLRYRLLDWNGLQLGPVVGWRFGRDQDDANRLLGLGDVDGGIVVGAYAALDLGLITPFVSYNHQVTADDTGGLLRFGAESDFALTSSVSVRAMLGAAYADDAFMDAYFSVSAAQSRASLAGLPVYDADPGIKSVYFGLATDTEIYDDWILKIGGRYSRLVGDAADSPIVESENQFYGGLGLSYRFDLSR